MIAIKDIVKKDIVEEVLNSLSGKEKPYLSEAQFQFELAWELKKKLGEEVNILLEYTSCARKATGDSKRKRFESDIILATEKDYIVIELKYKTKEAKINGVNLTQQAGQPGTKYDYLWDIHRIELLMNQDSDNQDSYNYEYYIKDKKCTGGFAIFLTNDPSYWKEAKKGESAYNFSLHDSSVKNAGEKLEWSGEKKDWMNSRPAFSLDYTYKMEWEKFMSYGEEKEFKYLITEIG